MLVIEFNEFNLPPIRSYNYAVSYDNNGKKVVFRVKKETDNLDLSSLTPYLKMDNADKTFADKVKLDMEVEDNILKLTWTILRVQSKYQHLRTQIQFEDDLNDVVYQFPLIEFNIDRTIRADEEVENLYPSVIQDLQKQIDELGTDYLKQNTYDSIVYFPQIGESGQLYVSKEENAIYRWDADTYTYICIARDYNEIDTIRSIL